MESAFVLFVLCLYVSWMDLRHRRIPNQAIGTGFFLLTLCNLAYFSPAGWIEAVFYTLLCLLVFGFVSWHWPLALGMGDVKLLALICYGLGVREFVVVLTVASMLALIVSILLLLMRRVSVNSSLPFAPFVTLGIAAAFF